jgi:hypothetical protein
MQVIEMQPKVEIGLLTLIPHAGRARFPSCARHQVLRTVL